MAEEFDVIIIGSGPGGYYAGIRCAQRGASVALIEKGDIGGVCLNVGCIPSKTLLASAHTLIQIKNAGAMGVDVSGVSANWEKIQQRREAVVTGFRKGLEGLLKSNKVKIYVGRGVITAPRAVAVEAEQGTTQLKAAKGIIIATGSEPIEIPAFKFDGETVISSTEALSLREIPNSMVVVGGGIIGCELACVYAGVGTKVTIVEALERIINTEDEWVSKLMQRELKKLGIDIMTGQKVTGVDAKKRPAVVSLESGKQITAEKVLVSAGRRAICDKETIENLGLQVEGGVIKVDNAMQTNVEGVYAIGDVVGTTYLAHGASAEAEVAVENILGGDSKMADYSLIPRAVYTFPEVASVGKNEKMCAEAGIELSVGRGFFRANGRSIAHNETTGEIRVIRDKASEKILGVTMVGANVTELVSAARLLIGSSEKSDEVVFPHPTFSEVLKEAWEDAFGQSVHQPAKTV